MIRLDGVGVELGGATILDAVSLSVERGEFVAVVGPNGAGKTTLIRTINGMIDPARGTVTVDGHDIDELSARETARLVATVPQETAFDFEFSVEDVVLMGRTPHRGRFATTTTADWEAVETALEQTETAQFRDRAVTTLSGGERQRVVLARALAQDTPVLLLDEPTANLDINHQIQSLSVARACADRDQAVVAAIHDLELAARFCDRVVLVHDGRVRASGSPADVLSDPATEDAFAIRTAVSTNPVTGTTTVTPLDTDPPTGIPVHVVGRGTRASHAIGHLTGAGFEVTVGIVPETDIATETARKLAADVVTTPPFEAVDETARERAATLRDAAAVTVVASPLSEPNRTVAADADRLVALENTNPPADTPVVTGDELVAELRSVTDGDRRQSQHP